ncbi:MAG: slipin family protein [Acidobacteriota bacterium]|nr:slipin family protein [Acidobacteriota bacterium]
MRGSLNIYTAIIWVITVGAAVLASKLGSGPNVAVAVAAAGALFGLSPRMINEWERGIVLRLGRFQRVVIPGISWVIPGIDQVARIVDMRVRSTPFSAEKTLSKDTVPMNVDAVLFWVVTDAKKAILEVEGYEKTISWLAQTTLRDVIGKTELVGLISDREALDEELRTIIDGKTSEWGITVQSVEIRDVVIPNELEDAMSRKAQAEREREARIILSDSEVKVAEKMSEAAKVYTCDHMAMQLRAMNMTYESIKEKGALMVIPSDMVNSTSLNSVMGMAAMAAEPGGGS